jgi:hypothetical protein
MDPLGAELLLQFGPSLGDGLSISPLQCGANLDPSLATPKIDTQLGTRIGPKDRRHRRGTQALQEYNLTGELIRQASDRPCLGKWDRLRKLRQSIRLSNQGIQ